MKMRSFLLALMCCSLFWSCKDDDAQPVNEPQLIIKFKFDPTQERLGNLGTPVGIPEGNAAQSPNFNVMSAHYIELAPTATTALGDGQIIYKGLETTAGGANAVDFQQAKIVTENETFLSIPLNSVQAGTYEWARISLTYQNYNIGFLFNGTDYTGTLASFVGFNNYITNYDVDTQNVIVNDNKLQGYWAFETLGNVSEGQAPDGATTVPNPIANTSPVPPGSCVVTGEFENGFTITGEETQNVVITMSLSTNNSFEWTEVTADGKFEPSIGEQVVDMGFRGLKPIVE
ncbi:hypothetical protein [Pseudofulvibacter geojedonensis]|uniref:Lipoprotein n=1 Tax=Pseudofulvibacter geojedonensis TaxID=1123758 RepID=A0ABW3I3P1_9FLAO